MPARKATLQDHQSIHPTMFRVICFIVFALGVIKLVLSDRFRLLDVVGPLLLLIAGAFLLRDKDAGREPSLRRGKRDRTALTAAFAPPSGGVRRSRDGAVEQRVYDTDLYGQNSWNMAASGGSDNTRSSCQPGDGSSTDLDTTCSSGSND